MDPLELASEPPRSRIGAASNSVRAFKSIGLGNVRGCFWACFDAFLLVVDASTSQYLMWK